MRRTFYLLIICLFTAGLGNSCQPIKYVPIQSYSVVRDTSVRRDNQQQYLYKESILKDRVRDTIRIITDSNGNVKSTHRITDRYVERTNKDSLSYYRQLTDSLRSLRADTIRIPYPVEKELSKFEDAKMKLGGLAIGGIAIFILYTALKWIIRRKMNIF